MVRRRVWFDLHVRGFIPETRRGWALIACGAAWLLALPFLAIASGVAGVLLFAASCGCAVLDWRGYVGLLAPAWRRSRSHWVRFLIACAFLLGLPVPVYLYREVRTARGAYLAIRRAKIRALERSTGLDRTR